MVSALRLSRSGEPVMSGDTVRRRAAAPVVDRFDQPDAVTVRFAGGTPTGRPAARSR